MAKEMCNLLRTQTSNVVGPSDLRMVPSLALSCFADLLSSQFVTHNLYVVEAQVACESASCALSSGAASIVTSNRRLACKHVTGLCDS